MTTTVGAYEAKTHLPRLLDQVEAGEDVVITRHGRPVARLVGVGQEEPSAVEIFRQLSEIRAQVRPDPGGPTVRQMIDEGRR